jgi:hypothetical protein
VQGRAALGCRACECSGTAAMVRRGMASLQSVLVSVVVGRAVVAGLVAVLAGTGRGGGGEDGVAGSEPAESDELPRAGDHQRCVLGVLVVEVGSVGRGMALSPGAAFGAEPAEGDGVAAGLGGEVAAEASIRPQCPSSR